MIDLIQNFLSENAPLKSNSKTVGFISVEGTPVEMPFTFINGVKPGKSILITGGVHGGEYPCIETAIQLANELEPASIKGTILIIHPVNPAAFLARMQYYGPYDGKNLNRVFPGKATGTVSERIAYQVHQFQQAADFYLDLHGGDIHEALVPFVIYSKLGSPEKSEEARLASALLGFPYVVGSVSENGSIGAAAKAGTPGFLAELGQCGRWSFAEVDQYKAAVLNVLRSFEVIPGEVQHSNVEFLDKMLVTTATAEGCWYPAVHLEQRVIKGEKLGEIRDFFGKVKAEYFADADGIVLYLVTSLAIMENDPLAAIGVSI
ncbi:succinylglutamate desuccinylase/aspartoacylase family protein [Algoriphagus pacificus]|uniref:Succinylglutamate desuccinylase/aspartoacylase family protein n=1 Tax=Algoriphagus pacificus TaxID=2811234 RepID=A0ABS3CI49_9BACT|nr:M14 family metallopeptidase [Algoriphagus pacificus]MBN7816772.1 succinylglutamate desuccinylase/aspartoacylase family protein [Algoriphagus pacificus]